VVDLKQKIYDQFLRPHVSPLLSPTASATEIAAVAHMVNSIELYAPSAAATAEAAPAAPAALATAEAEAVAAASETAASATSSVPSLPLASSLFVKDTFIASKAVVALSIGELLSTLSQVR